jgi:phosphoribosylformylglycinamidine synthase
LISNNIVSLQVYVGDNTLSVLEIWGAEYQENNALLIRPSDEAVFKEIAERENCPIRILGEVTGDGKVVVFELFWSRCSVRD